MRINNFTILEMYLTSFKYIFRKAWIPDKDRELEIELEIEDDDGSGGRDQGSRGKGDVGNGSRIEDAASRGG